MRVSAAVLLLAIAVATARCGKDSASPIGPSATSSTSPTTPAAAQAHLDDLLGVMRRYSVNRDVIDWENLRTEVMAVGLGQATPDIQAAVAAALRRLNDHESYYVGRDGRPIGPSPVGGCGAAASNVVSVPETVGYVRVAGCLCQGAAEVTQFAESIQRAIRTADREGLVGWIVDFHGNGGGNMWPMIAGIGPVLNEGIIGWIVYNDREYEREYVAGGAQSFGEVFAQVTSPYTLHGARPAAAGPDSVARRRRPRQRSDAAPCGSGAAEPWSRAWSFSSTDGRSAPSPRRRSNAIGMPDRGHTAPGASRRKSRGGRPRRPDRSHEGRRLCRNGRRRRRAGDRDGDGRPRQIR